MRKAFGKNRDPDSPSRSWHTGPECLEVILGHSENPVPVGKSARPGLVRKSDRWNGLRAIKHGDELVGGHQHQMKT